MYAKVWNYLRGSVLFQCESPAPERVLNLCGVYGIPFWDVQWETAERFTLRTTRQGAAALEDAAAECGAELRRMEEWGAPTALRRMRRRYVLWGTLAAVLALFWYGNTFIWDFQVTGNETVPTEKILRALENSGVTTGTRSLSFDQEELRNHVLLELGDISWLSVNVKGCTAHVQVVERKRPPEIVDRSARANVVAARDGLVTRVEALDGKALVMAGSTVTKGQLLISGVADSKFGVVRFMQGRGRVYARTWYELSVRVPMTAVEKSGEGKTTTRVALDVGKQRIKIYGKGSMLGTGCDKIVTYHPLTLPFGLRLPLTLAVETTTAYDTQSADRTAAQALIPMFEAAKADGVEFYYGMRPTRITDDGVYYKKVEMDEEGNITSTSEEQFFPCSSVIIAISQGAQNRIVSTTTGLEMSSHGLLATDEHGHTTREGIFASGDVVLGARTVVEAVKYSKQVAEEMDEYLTKRREK